MSALIQHGGFKRASMATADDLLRVIRRDDDAFRDETDRPTRLTAVERLERLRQRAVTR